MIFSGLTTFAQLKSNNLHAIDVTGGYAENGFGISVAYNYHLQRARRNDYIQVSGLYTSGNIKKKGYDLSYSLITANIGYFYNIPLDNRDKINLNIGAGGVIGVESINNGKTELDTGAIIDSEGGLVYGGFVGAEFDVYLNENFSLLIRANEFYHANSDVGDLTPYVGGGIRIFL